MTEVRSPNPGSFSEWIATLAEPAFETFVGCILAIAVVLDVLWEIHRKTPIDPNATWILTTVIGALLGAGHLSYRVKRETWKSDGDAPDDTDPTTAPAKPPPA